MSDIASELPVRSQLPGQVLPDDIIVKIGDGTNPTTQFLAVDSAGKVVVKLDDAAGNGITSQVNGAQRALDVGIDVAGVQIDPRQIRALTAADVVTANQGSAAATHASPWWTRLTDGTNNSVLLATGELTVAVTQPLPAGANNIGSVNQGTSPWIVKDQADGPVSPGTAALFSQLAGGVFNSAAPTLTNGQQSALQLDSAGRLLVTTLSTDDHNYGTVGANTLRTAAQIGNATGAADFNFGSASGQTLRVAALLGNASGVIDFNYGAVGAQTVRVASQIGNATGTADYNNGATGAQTLRVAANLAVGGANVSATNPVPVSFSSAPLGTPVNNYNTASAIAAGSSSNHDYAITSAKTFQGKKIWASASGLMKIEVQVSPDGTAFSTLWVGFNSTADSNITIDMDEMVFLESGVGAKIRIIRTNLDKKAMDLYSTISGTEV
jgi:hypothetical protein